MSASKTSAKTSATTRKSVSRADADHPAIGFEIMPWGIDVDVTTSDGIMHKNVIDIDDLCDHQIEDLTRAIGGALAVRRLCA